MLPVRSEVDSVGQVLYVRQETAQEFHEQKPFVGVYALQVVARNEESQLLLSTAVYPQHHP